MIPGVDPAATGDDPWAWELLFRRCLALAYGGRAAMEGERCVCGRQAAVVLPAYGRERGRGWCGQTAPGASRQLVRDAGVRGGPGPGHAGHATTGRTGP